MGLKQWACDVSYNVVMVTTVQQMTLRCSQNYITVEMFRTMEILRVRNYCCRYNEQMQYYCYKPIVSNLVTQQDYKESEIRFTFFLTSLNVYHNKNYTK